MVRPIEEAVTLVLVLLSWWMSFTTNASRHAQLGPQAATELTPEGGGEGGIDLLVPVRLRCLLSVVERRTDSGGPVSLLYHLIEPRGPVVVAECALHRRPGRGEVSGGKTSEETIGGSFVNVVFAVVHRVEGRIR